MNKTNESEDLGTDFYDKNLKKVKTIPINIIMVIFLPVKYMAWNGKEKNN